MAEVRPPTFPLRENTEYYSRGEHMLYDACFQLPHHWYALYSVSWIIRQAGRWASEGECDFVFIAPEIGLVVVEVKGGGVGRDLNSWYSIDAKRERHVIKNPVAQAQKGRFALMEYLRENGHEALMTRCCSTHMVCFPNLLKRDIPLFPELPASLIIASDDLPKLGEKLREGSFASNARRSTLSQEDCRILANALRPTFEAENRWPSYIWPLKYEIDRLTEEQKSALEMFNANKKVSLSGPAGCGKTIAAIEWAKQEIAKGRVVVVVVPTKALRNYYSSVLSNKLATVARPDEIAIRNLHEPSTLIILDEAQDLPSGLVHEGAHYCDGNDSQILIVHDSNQKLGRDHLVIPRDFARANFKKILRNTSQIAELASRFYLNTGLPAEIVGPSGQPVLEAPAKNKEEIPEKVSELIRELTENDEFSFRDIVVLFGESSGRFLREGGKTINGIKYRDAVKVWSDACDDARCIACCNIKEFRGMESSVVILCEVDGLLEHQLIEGAYVGMSRAQHLLAIVGLAGTLAHLRRRIGSHCEGTEKTC